MSVRRPFFSRSSAGITASGGIGLLAAAIKFFVLLEKYERTYSRRTKPLIASVVTID